MEENSNEKKNKVSTRAGNQGRQWVFLFARRKEGKNEGLEYKSDVRVKMKMKGEDSLFWCADQKYIC